MLPSLWWLNVYVGGGSKIYRNVGTQSTREYRNIQIMALRM
jgi:hypothetical protein